MASTPLRRIVRGMWLGFTALAVILVPCFAFEMLKNDYDPKLIAWFVAGVFVLLALPITFWEIAMHLEHYAKPHLQKHVIRILLMVPIYAVDSWFALRFSDTRIYVTPWRECYESVVIYSFYNYLLAYLEQPQVLGQDLKSCFELKEPVQHFFPVGHVMKPWSMQNGVFLDICRRGVIQYVIWRPVMAFITVISEAFGVFQEGMFTLYNVYPYVVIVNSVSQMWALYCLLMFYYAAREDLHPVRPIPKFICVKMVVFFTFWQSVFIALLIRFGVIRTKDSWTSYDKQDFGAAIQEFLICIEMFFAALVHAWAFSPRDYREHEFLQTSFRSNLRQVFDVHDIYTDVKDVAGGAVFKGPKHAADSVRETSRAFLDSMKQTLLGPKTEQSVLEEGTASDSLKPLNAEDSD